MKKKNKDKAFIEKIKSINIGGKAKVEKPKTTCPDCGGPADGLELVAAIGIVRVPKKSSESSQEDSFSE